jgi:hypothetical protein
LGGCPGGGYLLFDNENIMIPEAIKAKELYDKFNLPSGMMTREVKECAKICVDQIIEACEKNHADSYNTDWWLRVKAEIEKI